MKIENILTKHLIEDVISIIIQHDNPDIIYDYAIAFYEETKYIYDPTDDYDEEESPIFTEYSHIFEYDDYLELREKLGEDEYSEIVEDEFNKFLTIKIKKECIDLINLIVDSIQTDSITRAITGNLDFIDKLLNDENCRLGIHWCYEEGYENAYRGSSYHEYTFRLYGKITVDVIDWSSTIFAHYEFWNLDEQEVTIKENEPIYVTKVIYEPISYTSTSEEMVKINKLRKA